MTYDRLINFKKIKPNSTFGIATYLEMMLNNLEEVKIEANIMICSSDEFFENDIFSTA